jgi:hypothetical protein
LQLTTMLVETLKSGKITISQNNKEAIAVNIEQGHIDADVKDKEFVKQLVSASREGTNKKGRLEGIHRSVDSLREARKSRPVIKEMVEDLCREGVTITLSYHGDRVVTVGSEADSKLTRLVTGTKGIEINSPRRLAELGM